MRFHPWLSIFLVSLSGWAQAPPVHFETRPGPIEKEPAGLSKLQGRIREAETQVQEMIQSGRLADCPRLVLHDWAAASNQAEHEAISEGALIMLLAVSKDAAELPLQLAYVDRGETKPMRLVQIAHLPEAELRRLKLSGVLGSHVWAGLYWLPAMRRLEGKVRVDFAKNREDFGVGLNLPPDPKMFEGLVDKLQAFPGLPGAAVKAMAEREFPGFVFEAGYLDFLSRSEKKEP